MDKELYKFIPFFKQKNRDDTMYYYPSTTDGSANQIPYPIYHDKVTEFVKACYRVNLIPSDYSVRFASLGYGHYKEAVEDIDWLSFEQVRTILAYIIRSHYFSKAIFNQALEDGSIGILLSKLVSLDTGKPTNL